MTPKQIAFLFLLLSGAVPAMAADPLPGDIRPPRDAYRDVMAAQYAARSAPTAARPDEAKAIYDAYIKSIGQPVRDKSDLSNNSGLNTGTPSR